MVCYLVKGKGRDDMLVGERKKEEKVPVRSRWMEDQFCMDEGERRKTEKKVMIYVVMGETNKCIFQWIHNSI
jgi:hypothetical protein